LKIKYLGVNLLSPVLSKTDLEYGGDKKSGKNYQAPQDFSLTGGVES